MAVLSASVAMRAYAQERPWFPGDAGPDALAVQRRLGLASLEFDRTIPASWRSYYTRMLDDVVSDLTTVFPTLDLRGLNIRFEPLTSPALGPGLSLGGFPTEAQAKAALDQFAQRGVRTARVVQERAETRGQWLKFPQVDAAFRQRLEAGKPSLLGGSALRACPKPATSTP
mgnify:CR=1 FL=1